VAYKSYDTAIYITTKIWGGAETNQDSCDV